MIHGKESKDVECWDDHAFDIGFLLKLSLVLVTMTIIIASMTLCAMGFFLETSTQHIIIRRPNPHSYRKRGTSLSTCRHHGHNRWAMTFSFACMKVNDLDWQR